MNEEEIEIRHCSICQPVDRDEAKYQTDIITTDCFWQENLKVDYTLQQPPIVGNIYNVILKQPVKFKLHMNLWLFYDCPLAFYNGYGKEEEIDKARFCYGEITKILNYNEIEASIEFTVKRTLKFQEILSSNKTSEFLQEWQEFFMSFSESYSTGHLFSVQKFGKYYNISCSSQGDLGQNCIIGKNDNSYYACMMNEWSFHNDFKYGGKYKISNEFINLILEESEIAFRFYFNGKICAKLRNSVTYDTATPFQWCLNKLKEIKRMISESSFLTIVYPSGQSFEIKNNDEFINWLKIEFKGGFEEYLK